MNTYKDSNNSESELKREDFYPRVKCEDMIIPRARKRYFKPRELKLAEQSAQVVALFHEQNPNTFYTMDMPEMNLDEERIEEFEAQDQFAQ